MKMRCVEGTQWTHKNKERAMDESARCPEMGEVKHHPNYPGSSIRAVDCPTHGMLCIDELAFSAEAPKKEKHGK